MHGTRLRCLAVPPERDASLSLSPPRGEEEFRSLWRPSLRLSPHSFLVGRESSHCAIGFMERRRALWRVNSPVWRGTSKPPLTLDPSPLRGERETRCAARISTPALHYSKPPILRFP